MSGFGVHDLKHTIMIKPPMKYLDIAYSPDGGSLGLVLVDRAGKRVSLTLDRAMNTPTYNRIFLDGRGLLSDAEENELLSELRRLARTHAGDETASDWLESFIDAIESRRGSQTL